MYGIGGVHVRAQIIPLLYFCISCSRSYHLHHIYGFSFDQFTQNEFLYSSADNQEVFAGLDNYVKLFTNSNFAPRFFGALKNNFIFFAIHMVVQNSIALMLAALISNERRRGANFYRTVYFMPTVLSVVIIGFIWNLILNPLWGVSKSILEIVNLGFLFKPWLGLPDNCLDDGGIDLGLAVYRHPDDSVLRCVDCHSRGIDGSCHGGWSNCLGRFSGGSNFPSSAHSWHCVPF